MPSDAFFKLEEEKKNKLLESAMKEFSVLPYEKVSVFKIAQKAGISRSVFYYYFKDKRDIYNYLIAQLKMEIVQMLDQNGGGAVRYFYVYSKALSPGGPAERNGPGSLCPAGYR